MSAKLAELLATLSEKHAELAESYAELSQQVGGEEDGDGKGKGKGKTPAKGAKEEDLPPPKGKGKTAAKGKAKEPTEDDVREVAKKVIDKHGKEKVVEILSEFGDGKLASVDETDYAACIEALNKALEEDDGDI